MTLNRTRIAVIVDNLRLCRWQAEALEQISDDVEILVLNCTNTTLKRRAFRHGLYYVLNIIALKPPPTRSVEIPASLKIVQRLDFESEQEGAWQRLPARVTKALADWQPALAVKFGMGLMRIPLELDCKILSYHHGDPREFRGRPAGFYELLQGRSVIGQMVQVISNKLDGGEVVAFAETAALSSSYRATMDEAYRRSPLLLPMAIRNCLDGKNLGIAGDGKNYRLPSNFTVLRFATKLAAAKARRFLYGALFQKEWQVAWAEAGSSTLDDLTAVLQVDRKWNVLPRPASYQFLADPFPHPHAGVLVEALRKSDGQGEIILMKEGRSETICTGMGHFSYPGTFKNGDDWLMIPEVSEWSSPKIYRLSGQSAECSGSLDVEGKPRLADPTLYAHDGHVYLFGNDSAEGSAVLRLWVADSPFSFFREHPSSPIRISPAGSRMAGAIIDLNGRIYRPGQDGSQGYGKGAVLFEVKSLSPQVYEEVEAAHVRFSEVCGPHTINLQGGRVYFDFYRDKFTTLAGLRRVRAAMAKRKARKELDRLMPGKPVRGLWN